MLKTILLLTLFSSVFFLSCSPDMTTVQVIRNPIIKFNYNGTTAWQDNTYSFAPVTQTVVYPSDPTQPGQLYYRYILRATGQDDAGNKLELDITFDVVDANELVGVYTPAYTTQRGLAQVQLFNLTDNSLAAYSLCPDALATAQLQIQKQKEDERLITGTFEMTLCNTRDAAQKINITSGVITDITY